VLPFSTVAAVLLCAALALLLAALNVYARDTEHLLDLLILAWFWLTPILYQYARVTSWLTERNLPAYLAMVNPFTPLVITFQRAIYGTDSTDTVLLLPDVDSWWYLRNVAVVAGVSIVLLLVALRLFDRAEANFAEAL
jgi:ABC-2 type transport system permease protein